jgi:small-conductance mechanosensitive channel
MGRYATIIGVACFVAGLWVLYGLAGDYRIFGAVDTANAVLWVACLATALVLVVVIGRLLLGVGFVLFGHQATGLERGIIYSVLTFILISVLLASLGVNITAILTTSVVATAIVGLAVQPTLGGIIAGSALQLDRVLRVGDIILLDHEGVEVVSLNWRSVVGLKDGGITVVIPNARIAESRLDILRGDQPVRVDLTIPAPMTVPPHRISEILTEAVYDLYYTDAALPVTVQPISFHSPEGFVTYSVQYWTALNRDQSRASAALLSRVWYLYQREQIPWPVPNDFVDAPGLAGLPATDQFKGLRLDQLVHAKISGLGPIVLATGLSPKLTGSVIAECGPPLCYADGELLRVPRRLDKFSLFLLVEGAAREASPADAALMEPPLEAEVSLARQADRRMAVERVATVLAQYIGPYAEYAVREAAAADPDPIAVCKAVAQEIDDPIERKRFLSELRMDYHETRKPGFVFGLQGRAYGRGSSRSLRAAGGAIIIPITLKDDIASSKKSDSEAAVIRSAEDSM